MNDNSILMIFVGSLIVVILVLLYLYLATSKNLKKLEIINKELDESNSNKITEIAVLEEKIHSSEKLLENTSLEKKLIEQELSIRELANKNVDIDKDIAKTNQKFDTKFDSTFTELKENSEKIGLLYGNSQNQGNFGEYSLDLVFEQANYTEGHNYFRQKSFSFVDSDGKSRSKRPDFVVPRPLKGDGIMNIVIDAKTPLSDFKDWVNAKKSDEKRAILDKLEENFIKKIHKHAASLVKDDYQSYIPNAFSKIIMFVPIEDMRTMVLNSSKLYNFDKKDQTILEYLFNNNIWISSRSDILNTLDMIREMYDKKNQTDNINAIVKVAKDIAGITRNVILGANKYIDASEKATKTMRRVITSNDPGKHIDKLNTIGMSDESIGFKDIEDKHTNQAKLRLVDNEEENYIDPDEE
tara:strand:- start:3841 stop:5073 length:1233 start_codon:yes stop_codon:yes gene_type:complete